MAAPLGLSLAEHQVGTEVDPARQSGETGRRHDGGPPGAQVALVVGGMAGIQLVGDGEADDRVAEEFEALVVAARDVGVLVLPARMDEGLFKEIEVADRESDPCREGLGWTDQPGGPAGARVSG